MPSYLLKNRNGNYYTRVSFPQELKLLGCPRELRISLFTKDRAMAMLRNLVAAHGIKLLMENFRVNEELKKRMAEKRLLIRVQEMMEPELESLRERFRQSELARIKVENEAAVLQANLDDEMGKRTEFIAKARSVATRVKTEREVTEKLQTQLTGVQQHRTLAQLQIEFINRKEAEGITMRSVQQLRTRINTFVMFTGEEHLAHNLRFKDADEFLRELSIRQGLKEKTCREYKAACSQMFAYAVKMEYAPKNPFEQITVKSGAATPRQRWEHIQLKTLFSSANFTQHSYNNVDDFWIPLVLLHTGARPAEICQLQTSDVVFQDGILCVRITEDGDNQSIKTGNAKRLVPVHNKLIELGFQQFVDMRIRQGMKQLFSCKPTGKYNEWAKNFERRFDRYLASLGFVAGQRPTAYSFRHTVVDELQRLDISEHVVADLVGHSKKGFTYRHYGKATQLQRLKEVIEQLNFDDALTFTSSWPC